MTSISHRVRRRNNNNKDVTVCSQLLLVSTTDEGDNNDENKSASTPIRSSFFASRRKRRRGQHQHFLSSFTISGRSLLLLLMDRRTNSNNKWIIIFLVTTTIQALVIVIFVLWSTHNTSPVMIFTKEVLLFTSNHFWMTPSSQSTPSLQESFQSTIIHSDGNNIQHHSPTVQQLLRYNRPMPMSPLENQTLLRNNNMNDEPLDDYYSRPHIKVSMNITTSNSNNKEEDDILKQLSVLIIGGSDGSGTRAFVDILGKLGVPMLADDGGTYDVHAGAMMNGQGWPPLVQTILHESNQQAANYSLTESTQQLAVTELNKLKQRFEIRALQLRKRGNIRNISMSQHVSYGFKAPVTMLLLPVLVQVFGKVKFVHVLRDGRDVALSDNGSPVMKFYNSYYAQNGEQRYTELQQQQWSGGEEHEKMVQTVQAMQLWNDWNVQVYEYCRQYNDGVRLDYLPMRTEDLLDESTKLASLIQLADFVGSMQTSKQLCCKSRLEIVDMGGSNEKMGRRLPTASNSKSNMNNRQKSQQHHLDWWGQILSLFASWGITNRPEAETVPAFGSQHFSSEYQMRKQHDNDPTEDLNDEADIPMESVFLEQLKLRQGQQRQQQPQNGRLGHLANHIGGREAALDGHPHHGWQHRQNIVDSTTEAAAENILHRRLVGQEQNNSLSLLHLETSDAELFRNLLKRKQEAMYRETMVEETPAAEKNLRKDLLNHPWDVERQDRPLSPLKDVMTQHQLQHPHHGRGTAEEVKKRYGKWATALEGKPTFSAFLHQQGARGLQLFGYEPNRRFADNNVPPQLFCPCDETVECSKEDTLLMAPAPTR